jgi:predicted membrane metal-binding protein
VFTLENVWASILKQVLKNKYAPSFVFSFSPSLPPSLSLSLSLSLSFFLSLSLSLFLSFFLSCFLFRVSKSSLKFKPPHNCQELSQRYKLQPGVIRVTAYKTGSETAFAKITVLTFYHLGNQFPTISILYVLFSLKYKQLRKIIIV